MNVTFLIIRKILPFVKEMIFGKGKISQIIRYDRRRFYFFLIIIGSFVINVFSIPSYFRDIVEAIDPNAKPSLSCTDLEAANAEYQRKEYLANQFKNIKPK